MSELSESGREIRVHLSNDPVDAYIEVKGCDGTWQTMPGVRKVSISMEAGKPAIIVLEVLGELVTYSGTVTATRVIA